MGPGSCRKIADESSLLNHPRPSSCAEVVPVWALILKLAWQQVYMYVFLYFNTYYGILFWKLDSPWFDPPFLYTNASGVPPLRLSLTANSWRHLVPQPPCAFWPTGYGSEYNKIVYNSQQYFTASLLQLLWAEPLRDGPSLGPAIITQIILYIGTSNNYWKPLVLGSILDIISDLSGEGISRVYTALHRSE